MCIIMVRLESISKFGPKSIFDAYPVPWKPSKVPVDFPSPKVFQNTLTTVRWTTIKELFLSFIQNAKEKNLWTTL